MRQRERDKERKRRGEMGGGRGGEVEEGGRRRKRRGGRGRGRGGRGDKGKEERGRGSNREVCWGHSLFSASLMYNCKLNRYRLPIPSAYSIYSSHPSLLSLSAVLSQPTCICFSADVS